MSKKKKRARKLRKSWLAWQREVEREVRPRLASATGPAWFVPRSVDDIKGWLVKRSVDYPTAFFGTSRDHVMNRHIYFSLCADYSDHVARFRFHQAKLVP